MFNAEKTIDFLQKKKKQTNKTPNQLADLLI